MTHVLSPYAPSVQAVLGFVEYYWDTCGYSPTRREIVERTGFQMTTVNDAVRTLEAAGYIRRKPNVRRNLELIEQECAMKFKLYPVGDGQYRLWHEAASGEQDVMIELWEDGIARLILPGGVGSRPPILNLGRLLVAMYQDRLEKDAK